MGLVKGHLMPVKYKHYQDNLWLRLVVLEYITQRIWIIFFLCHHLSVRFSHTRCSNPGEKTSFLILTFSNVSIRPRRSDSAGDGAPHSAAPTWTRQLPASYLCRDEYIQRAGVTGSAGAPAARVLDWVGIFFLHKNNVGSLGSISSSHLFHILYEVYLKTPSSWYFWARMRSEILERWIERGGSERLARSVCRGSWCIFASVISLNLHSGSGKGRQADLCRTGDWDSERLSYLPEITQSLTGQPGPEVSAVWLQSSLSWTRPLLYSGHSHSPVSVTLSTSYFFLEAIEVWNNSFNYITWQKIMLMPFFFFAKR